MEIGDLVPMLVCGSTAKRFGRRRAGAYERVNSTIGPKMNVLTTLRDAYVDAMFYVAQRLVHFNTSTAHQLHFYNIHHVAT